MKLKEQINDNDKIILYNSILNCIILLPCNIDYNKYETFECFINDILNDLLLMDDNFDIDTNNIIEIEDYINSIFDNYIFNKLNIDKNKFNDYLMRQKVKAMELFIKDLGLCESLEYLNYIINYCI